MPFSHKNAKKERQFSAVFLLYLESALALSSGESRDSEPAGELGRMAKANKI